MHWTERTICLSKAPNPQVEKCCPFYSNCPDNFSLQMYTCMVSRVKNYHLHSTNEAQPISPSLNQDRVSYQIGFLIFLKFKKTSQIVILITYLKIDSATTNPKIVIFNKAPTWNLLEFDTFSFPVSSNTIFYTENILTYATYTTNLL